MIVNYNEKLSDVSEKFSHKVVNADGSTEYIESSIVTEHNLLIYVNEQLFAKLVCTKSDLVELVIGRLISEGIIKTCDEIESIYICEEGYVAKVFLCENVNLTPVANEVPTCCTDNKILLGRSENEESLEMKSDKLPALPCMKKVSWEAEWIFNLADAFSKGSKIHRSTNGTHSCYLSVGEKIAFTCEDIGRHNAIDKATGYIAMNGIEKEKCILFTSGRVPVDMVKKVIRAQIPILVSKAVPTIQAVSMAKEYNLTLICKAWPDRIEIFNEAE